MKTKYYESGEKAGTLLARQFFNQVFYQFYSKLYSSESIYSQKELNDFLAKVILPTLSTDERDAPITQEEIRTIVMSLKSGKSPGSDGFPVEYYKKFVDELTPILTEVYSEVFEDNMLPDNFNEALNSLILKPERDTRDPANYRPISLLNVESLNKIISLTIRRYFT